MEVFYKAVTIARPSASNPLCQLAGKSQGNQDVFFLRFHARNFTRKLMRRNPSKKSLDIFLSNTFVFTKIVFSQINSLPTKAVWLPAHWETA